MESGQPRFDEIGYWSEVKLEIVKKYAKAYSTILAKQPKLSHIYIDGFAGSGIHLARSTKKLVPGSPLNALHVVPKFAEYYFIDLDGNKTDQLRKLIGPRSDVYVLQGDCNDVLLKDVFPRVRYEDFRRGLCLLDPYGLHLNWEVLATAGRMRSIEVFLNFPVMDINRNALWQDPERVPPQGRSRAEVRLVRASARPGGRLRSDGHRLGDRGWRVGPRGPTHAPRLGQTSPGSLSCCADTFLLQAMGWCVQETERTRAGRTHLG